MKRPLQKYESLQYEELGKALIEAIKSLDINEFIKLKPTAEMWKVISPDECTGKTDEEIFSEQINDKKLQFAFDNIMNSAKETSLDLSKLTYSGVEPETLGGIPVALTVNFTYEGRQCNIRISLASYNNQIYMADIKNSYQLFKEF